MDEQDIRDNQETFPEIFCLVWVPHFLEEYKKLEKDAEESWREGAYLDIFGHILLPERMIGKQQQFANRLKQYWVLKLFCTRIHFL